MATTTERCNVIVRVTPETRKAIKRRALDRDETVQDYLTALIENDLAKDQRGTIAQNE